MKQIKLIIILFLFSSILKAQIIRRNCDTIILYNGVTYYGVVTAMSSRVVKFINCDTFGLPMMTVYLKDVRKLNYDRIQNNLAKQRQQKVTVKAIEKQDKLIQLVDTGKYIHVGIIPYQFLTRSSGLYLRYDFKTFSLEYRPTYTYATNLQPNEFVPFVKYDNFFFQGINNSLIFYFPCRGRTQVGLMLSYKYWWHGKEPIDNDNSIISGRDDDLHLTEIRSTVMNGFGLGVEFTHYRKTYEKLDCHFFWSAALTYFNSYSHVYSRSYINWSYASNPYYQNMTYPYTETKSRIYFNLTCGFKFGFKKQLKK